MFARFTNITLTNSFLFRFLTAARSGDLRDPSGVGIVGVTDETVSDFRKNLLKVRKTIKDIVQRAH